MSYNPNDLSSVPVGHNPTDLSPLAPPAPASPATPAPALDYGELARALIAQGAVPGAPAPAEVPAKAPVGQNLFTKGQLVTHTAVDHYAGGRPVTTYGLVLDTLPDEGAGARSVVLWLGSTPAVIGDHELEAG